MELGAFSISLPVADVTRSAAFYETLGFTRIAGDVSENWLILRNGPAVIGLFHGHITEPLLTFNPGWVSEDETLETFDDIRDIQRKVQDAGYEIETPADPDSRGPANVTLRDPDGHAVFLDQHVPAPKL